MNTKYAIIEGTEEQIESFKEEIEEDIDYIISSIKKFLDMPSDNIVTIILCDDMDEVRAIYKNRYNQDCDYKAFISLSALTIWVSVEDVDIHVISHELGHAILEAFCNKMLRMPYNIHELIAQYTEKNIRKICNH